MEQCQKAVQGDTEEIGKRGMRKLFTRIASWNFRRMLQEVSFVTIERICDERGFIEDASDIWPKSFKKGKKIQHAKKIH